MGRPDPGPWLHDLVEGAAQSYPGHIAIVDAGRQVTYFELFCEVLSCRDWLAGRGVRRRDRVVVISKNSIEAIVLIYAISMLGATAVPWSPALKPFVLERLLVDCEPRLILGDSAASSTLRSSGIDHVDIDEVTTVVAQAAATEPGAAGRAQVSRFPGDGDSMPMDPVLLMYTSGSSSTPKGVVGPHASVMFVTSAIAARLDYRDRDVVLCALPFSFDYGLYQAFLCALVGATLVLGDTEGNALEIFRTIIGHRVTVLPITPSIASNLLRVSRMLPEGAPSVRLITNTGAHLPETTARDLRARFSHASIVAMYGLTECKRVSVMESDGDLARPRSVGRPLTGTEVVIVDEAGEPVAPGVVGEIVVRGRHVMDGYWRAPGLTARRFERESESGKVRLLTGDFGWMDEDGYLYIEGRRDDIFKQRGTRVSTQEIEFAALDVPGVSEAIAVRAEGGATLFYVGSPMAGSVSRELSRRLEWSKLPVRCIALAELPLTPNGKVDKRTLGGLGPSGPL